MFSQVLNVIDARAEAHRRRLGGALRLARLMCREPRVDALEKGLTFLFQKAFELGNRGRIDRVVDGRALETGDSLEVRLRL